MANNPFDPPIVQVKKTLDRGGIGTVNRGFGSIATTPATPRAPEGGPQSLAELDDVDGNIEPEHGQVLVYNGATGLWEPEDQSGGGGGANVSDRKWVRGSTPTTDDDEFNDGVLNPAWAIVPASVYPAGAVPTYTEGADVLSVKYGVNSGAGGSTADGATGRHVGIIRALSSPLAVGDAIYTCFTPMIRANASHRMSGIVLSTSAATSGNEQLYHRWWTTGFLGMRRMTGWVGDITIGSGDFGYGYSAQTDVYQRIVRLSATTWRGDVSPDGVNWILGNAIVTWAFEPTHYGFADANWNTATPSITRYEFIRRVSGVS